MDSANCSGAIYSPSDQVTLLVQPACEAVVRGFRARKVAARDFGLDFLRGRLRLHELRNHSRNRSRNLHRQPSQAVGLVEGVMQQIPLFDGVMMARWVVLERDRRAMLLRGMRGHSGHWLLIVERLEDRRGLCLVDVVGGRRLQLE